MANYNFNKEVKELRNKKGFSHDLPPCLGVWVRFCIMELPPID